MPVVSFGKLSTILACAHLLAQEKPVPLWRGMGLHHHPIETLTAEAQRYFDQGLVLLYGFDRPEARRSFQKAAELDPKAATPHWGIAATYAPHINMDLDGEFTIDVAEDMNKFGEHRTAVGVDPVRGSQFVTEGNIYPAFTIQGKGEQFDPNMPGSRRTWFCKGVFLVKGNEFEKSARAVLSDQVYLLPGDQHSIATTGAEGNGLSIRVMTGGTGPFAGYVGEQRRQFLGFNKTGDVNLRVTITLRKASS